MSAHSQRAVQQFNRIAWGDRDRQAALFAMWGFSNRFIESRTGLSAGQIGYRLKRLGLNGSRRDYRNGEGEVAEALVQRTSVSLAAPRPAVDAAIDRVARGVADVKKRRTG